MAYFNNNNTGFYPFSTFGEFDAYPSWTSANEQVHFGTFDTPTNGWSVDEQSAYAVDSKLTGLRGEGSFEPVSSITSYGAQVHDQFSYLEHSLPVAGRHSQSDRRCIVSRDNSFVSSVALEASAAIPTPSSFPLDYRGDNESGPFTNTFRVNAQIPYQPGTGSTRTGSMQTWRFRPYVMPHARSNRHTNAEAGPSNLAPPLVPYKAPLPTNPSGGISEATADAETIQPVTEEDAAPTTKRPRGTGPPRKWRRRYQQYLGKLCVWAEEWKGLAKTPSQGEALGIALEAVKSIRAPVYAEPRLAKGTGTRSAEGQKVPDAEYIRRKEARELNEGLSRYYPLKVNQSAWGCPELLLKVLEDVEALPKPSTTPSA